MKYRLFILLLISLLVPGLLQAETKKAIKLYPAEIIDTTGTIEFEEIVSSRNSKFKSIEAKARFVEKDKSLKMVVGFGGINYHSQKKDWRTFEKKKFSIPISIDRREASSGDSTRGQLGLSFSHYLGIEKSVYERISIGAEARTFFIAGLVDYIKDTSKDTSVVQVDLEMFDSFKIYFKVLFD